MGIADYKGANHQTTVPNPQSAIHNPLTHIIQVGDPGANETAPGTYFSSISRRVRPDPPRGICRLIGRCLCPIRGVESIAVGGGADRFELVVCLQRPPPVADETKHDTVL